MQQTIYASGGRGKGHDPVKERLAERDVNPRIRCSGMFSLSEISVQAREKLHRLVDIFETFLDVVEAMKWTQIAALSELLVRKAFARRCLERKRVHSDQFRFFRGSVDGMSFVILFSRRYLCRAPTSRRFAQLSHVLCSSV